MSRYNEDLDCLYVSISKEELEEIVREANLVISDANSDKKKLIEAYLKKAQCFQSLGKYAESTVIINNVLALNPNMPQALMCLGVMHLQNMDYKKALDYTNQAIAGAPCYMMAYFQRANAKHFSSDYHGAIEDFTKALEIAPHLPAIYINRGVAKVEVSDYRGAIDDFNKALEIAPHLEEPYYSRGVAKAHMSDYCGAIDDYSNVIHMNPNYVKAYIKRGNAKVKLFDYQGAIDDYSKALEIKPRYAMAYYNRGYVKDDLSDYRGVVDDCNKALDINPNFAEAYTLRGKAKRALFDNRGAIDDYNKALELNPKNAMAYNNRGSSKCALSYYQDAIEDFSKALEIDSCFALAYANRGNVRYIISDYRGAVEDCNKAIEIDPSCVWAYRNRGNVKRALSYYQDAIEDYTKAIEINSNYGEAYYNRGLAYINLKEYRNAAKDFVQVKADILGILFRDEDGETIVRYMLDDNAFFQDATEKCSSVEEKEQYKDIYLQSLRIIAKLQITDEFEMPVAHYTQVAVAEKLLFTNPSSFRLSLVTASNDREEGKTLFQCLFSEKNMMPQKEEFGAFAGCFIMNVDRLTQFRFYGKKDKQEGTGVSIAFSRNCFGEKIEASVKVKSELNRKNSSNLLPLFRCIYLDPEVPDFISLGQKEEYAFRKERKAEEYQEYKEEMEKLERTIKNDLGELKIAIKDLDADVVRKLLLHLRYLVKHAAFKEEQECRITRICPFENNTEVREDAESKRLYVDYLKLTKEYVAKICFAPQAASFEDFKQHLVCNGYGDIECYQSEAPLA